MYDSCKCIEVCFNKSESKLFAIVSQNVNMH